MVMSPFYTYERILQDSGRYVKLSEHGKFYAWWEQYLRDEGFLVCYRPFSDLYQLPLFHGHVVGLLGMDIPHLQVGHIVCVDEVGVVDPADGAPDHIDISQYVLNRKVQGVVFHSEFLAVDRRTARIE
jgi:hypothetical protein